MNIFDIRKDDRDAVRRSEGNEITITGCLGERYIGCGMKTGVLHVKGTPGNALAADEFLISNHFRRRFHRGLQIVMQNKRE